MRQFLKLFRLRLAFLNGVSTLVGYISFPAPANMTALVTVYVGAVLLAAGASALNQVQERDVDRLMERTRLRPIASGALSPSRGVVAGVVTILSGALFVGYFGGPLPVVIVGIIILWYLGVYTPLKRRSSLSVPAGSICGALAPVMGWCAAGGGPLEPPAMLLAGLFYLWQIPHFWLFQHRHRIDYLRAGMPVFEPSAVPFGCFRLWVFALGAGVMLLPLHGLMAPSVSVLFVLFLSPVLILSGSRWNRHLFSFVNCFPLLVVIAVITSSRL